MQIHAVDLPSDSFGYAQAIKQENYAVCSKTKKFKITVLAFFKQENLSTIKWHLSQNLKFQNLFKNRKLLPLGDILAFILTKNLKKLLSLTRPYY